MKYLGLFFVLIPFISNGQTWKHGYTHDSIGKSKFSVAFMNFDSYISKNGDTINVGDTIKLGSPSDDGESFNYISLADGSLINSYANSEQVVSRIRFENTSKLVQVIFKVGITQVFVEYENALQSGELKGKTGTMTSEQALKALKKAKTKLDLELITQDEYDKLKKKLAPFIR